MMEKKDWILPPISPSASPILSAVHQVELRVQDGTNLGKKDIHLILKAFDRFFEDAQRAKASGFQISGWIMSAKIVDLAMIRAERAAATAEAAAEAAWKRDPLNNPRVVLLVRQVLDQMIVDQERSKMRTSSNQEQ
jgi:hypothetical protein